jgi:hypothetical protein
LLRQAGILAKANKTFAKARKTFTTVSKWLPTVSRSLPKAAMLFSLKTRVGGSVESGVGRGDWENTRVFIAEWGISFGIVWNVVYFVSIVF